MRLSIKEGFWICRRSCSGQSIFIKKMRSHDAMVKGGSAGRLHTEKWDLNNNILSGLDLPGAMGRGGKIVIFRAPWS